ncbi:hypothetical protein [Spongiimicrobium salis]|uniref:hypothetical protein n=1 Tax=Spongiimicrobium salis TaxID=1667022 RepID=UPI00374CAC0A
MKKLIFIIILLGSFLGHSQVFHGFVRHGKKTTAQRDAIDVSDTSKVYTLYNVDTGREEINAGLGWVARFSGSGSDNSISEVDQTIGSNRNIGINNGAALNFNDNTGSPMFALFDSGARPLFHNGVRVSSTPVLDNEAASKIYVDNLMSGTGDLLANGTVPMTGALDLNLQNILNGGTGSFSLMNANLMAVGSGTGNPRIRFQTSPGFYIDLEGTASSLSYGSVDLLSPISSSVISQHTPVNYANTTSGTTLTGSLSGIDEVLGNLGKLVYTSSSGNRTLLPGDIISTAFPNRGRRVSIIVEDNSTITIDDTLPIGVPFVLGSGDLAEKLTIEFSGAIVYGEGVELVKATESVNKITVESGRTIVISKESSGNYRADGMWEVFRSALDLPSLIVKQTPETIDPTAVNEGDVVSVWNDSQSGFNATATTTTRGTLHIENGERQILFDGVDDFYTYGNVPQLDFTPGTDEFTIVLKIGHAVNTTKNQQLISKAQLNTTTSGQYSISLVSSIQRYYAGGQQSIESAVFAPGDVIIMIVRTTGMDVYRNDVQIVTNGAVGTVTTSNNVLLGSRFDGTTHNFEGSLSHVAIFNAATTAQEASAIYNEIK